MPANSTAQTLVLTAAHANWIGIAIAAGLAFLTSLVVFFLGRRRDHAQRLWERQCELYDDALLQALEWRHVRQAGNPEFGPTREDRDLGTSFAVVVAGRVLAALGAAGFQANAYAVAGLLAAPERRGRALAAVTAGSSLSTVLGVPFGVLVGQLAGWRGAMWVIAALALCVAVVIPALPAVHIPPTSMRTRLGVLVRPQALAVLSGTVLFPVLAAAGFGALRSISPERPAPGITREPTGQEMSQ